MLQQRHAVNTELPPTEPPLPHNGLPKPSKGLRRKVGQLTKLFKGLATGDDGKTDTMPVPTQIRPLANSPVTSTHSPDTINENRDNRNNGTNITNIYNGIEMSMRLRRLEDVPILTAALRQLIRTLHPKGDTITFPCPEAVDRIHLKSNGLPTESAELHELLKLAFERRDEVNGLPTESAELHELLKLAFERRDEVLDLEKTYSDFAKTHGRIAFDPTQKWPQSVVHTRHP
ncbi:hypothetical protein QE152_g30585 [Popillia japonica]|uniref:Uncharacterized protein n=1 Tax=Popillia japonica TaxID=7064 RepID=A0AAW1JED3_POPJA